MQVAALSRKVLAASASILCLNATVSAQGFSYIHPRSPPQAAEFAQPPPDRQWIGPNIKMMPARCWYAEPSNPTKPVGGSDETQKVVQFFDLELPPGVAVDATFLQTDLARLAGGGSVTELSKEKMPAGVFVSAIGHPIFKLTKVEYPVKNPLWPLLGGHQGGPGGTGAVVYADFMHLPNMGECHFYVAMWLAKRPDKPPLKKQE